MTLMRRCSRVGSVFGIVIHGFYTRICAETNFFVALRSNEHQKQRNEFKSPSKSNKSVGYKGAEEATKLSIISLLDLYARH